MTGWSQRPLPTQRTANTTDRQPCPQRDSNLQSQQSSGRRPMPTGIVTYTLKLVNLHKGLRFMRSATFKTQRNKDTVVIIFRDAVLFPLLCSFSSSSSFGTNMISSSTFSFQLFLPYFILPSELRLSFRTSEILRSYSACTLLCNFHFFNRKLSNIKLNVLLTVHRSISV
jgi:hypothetical protein